MRTRAALAVLFLVAVAAGCYLRLHLLASQILLDDEWHGVNQVIGRSFADLATSFNPKDNASVPFNLYSWLLYRYAHWSEATLRLPAVACGLLGLLLLPWMVGRRLGRGAAVVFASLLAVSPLLVFYGRFARAYSATVLLGLAVVFLWHRWLATGRARDGAATVLVGTLAIYVHLSATVTVFVPLAIACLALLADRLGAVTPLSKKVVASPRSLLLGGGALFALSLPALSPLFVAGSSLPWATGTPTMTGIFTALTLISGTSSVLWSLLFYALSVAGHVELARDEPLLSSIAFGVVGTAFTLLIVTRPEGIGAGLVIVRYMIAVVPIALIGVSVAIDRAAARLARRRRGDGSLAAAVVGAALAGALFLAGPLPLLQHEPNDFTGHSAFQGSYEPVRWDRSDARHVYPAFSLREDQVSPFYRALRGRADVHAIVEYPFDVCNHNDLLYFDQHRHGKRVFAGYCSDSRQVAQRAIERDPRHPEAVLSMLSADEILSRVPADGRIAFRNMVDLSDRRAPLASRAEIVVLHKTVMGVRKRAQGAMDAVPVRYISVDALSAAFRERFGEPVYEDGELVCFDVRGRH